MARLSLGAVIAFVLLGAVVAVAAYLTFASHNALTAIAVGIGAGVLFAIYMTQQPTQHQPPKWREYGFDVVVAFAGVAMVVFGLITWRLGLVVGGLPLVAFGVLFFLGRR